MTFPTFVSSVRLFTDRLIIHSEITSIADTAILQNDLVKMQKLCTEFYAYKHTKNVHMRVTEQCTAAAVIYPESIRFLIADCF